MTGAFNCVPVPCQQCAESALAIQRSDAATWAGKIATLPDESRECVREYLRGIWLKARAING